MKQKIYDKNLSRKNSQTGKSNYPTMTLKHKTVQYENSTKTISNRNYKV